MNIKPTIITFTILLHIAIFIQAEKTLQLRKNAIVRQPTKKLKKPQSCGISQKNSFQFRFEDKGYTRKHADIFEYPWTLAILKNKSHPVYHCGATLIHFRVALTAAHCVQGEDIRKDLLVIAGVWNSSSYDTEFHQTKEVHSVIKNENNDIALVFLSKPFDKSDNTLPICLPPMGYNFDNWNCVASGWGKNEFNNSHTAASLMKRVELQVVPSKTCEDELRQPAELNENVISKSFVCASGRRRRTDTDSCNGSGDGGSPLACLIPNKNKNRYYLAGLVSWEIECKNYPNINTYVAEFRQWIDNEMKREKLQLTYHYENN